MQTLFGRLPNKISTPKRDLKMLLKDALLAEQQENNKQEGQGECTLPPVLTVADHSNFPLNQNKIAQSIATSVTQNTKTDKTKTKTG